MREIGSEFWDLPLANEENHKFLSDVRWFGSGREALVCIIKNILASHTIARVGLPSWCCDSMIIPFLKQGFQITYYPVYIHGDKVIQNLSACQNCDVVLKMDYFGYSSHNIENKSNAIVIRDVTHSIFSRDYNDADYYFGSLRKWAGFWTGGFGWERNGRIISTKNQINEEYITLRKLAMSHKCEFIKKRDATDKLFLKLFNQAELLLESYEEYASNVRDVDCAKYLDINYIKTRRRKNAQILIEKLSQYTIFKLNEEDCPLFVPIRVDKFHQNKLKKHLIDNCIFCPIHWPISKYHSLDSRTSVLYNETISLVCDQRYNEKDMERMVSVIRSYFEGEK